MSLSSPARSQALTFFQVASAPPLPLLHLCLLLFLHFLFISPKETTKSPLKLKFYANPPRENLETAGRLPGTYSVSRAGLFSVVTLPAELLELL